MADIKQAAKWLRKGKRVRREDWIKSFPSWKLARYDEIVSDGVNPNPEIFRFLEAGDLLADDWEVVKGGQ